MKLSKEMVQALNRQINFEMASSYLYLGMSFQMVDKKMPGYASWLNAQATEEMTHANIFIKYLQDRNESVRLTDISISNKEYAQPVEVAKAVLAHEEAVTASIIKLMDMAKEESDYATFNFLQFFVGEQVEEESSAREVIEWFEMAGDHPASLFVIDGRLAARQSAK